MNSQSIYPALDQAALMSDELMRGIEVQVRYFYADSLPGTKARVVRYWDTPAGINIRCNFGKNLGGQSLLKTLPIDALALA